MKSNQRSFGKKQLWSTIIILCSALSLVAFQNCSQKGFSANSNLDESSADNSTVKTTIESLQFRRIVKPELSKSDLNFVCRDSLNPNSQFSKNTIVQYGGILECRFNSVSGQPTGRSYSYSSQTYDFDIPQYIGGSDNLFGWVGSSPGLFTYKSAVNTFEKSIKYKSYVYDNQNKLSDSVDFIFVGQASSPVPVASQTVTTSKELIFLGSSISLSYEAGSKFVDDANYRSNYKALLNYWIDNYKLNQIDPQFASVDLDDEIRGFGDDMKANIKVGYSLGNLQSPLMHMMFRLGANYPDDFRSGERFEYFMRNVHVIPQDLAKYGYKKNEVLWAQVLAYTQSRQQTKECSINLINLDKTYYGKGLFTTFVVNSTTGKIYQPDAQGNMNLPSEPGKITLFADLNKKDLTKPVIGVACNNGVVNVQKF